MMKGLRAMDSIANINKLIGAICEFQDVMRSARFTQQSYCRTKQTGERIGVE